MLDDLTARIVELVDGKDAVGFDVKIDLGETGRIFVAGKSAPMQISNSDQDAETSFILSAGTLTEMLDGTLAPMMAYMQGKLKVDGDLNQAMKAGAIFS